jgi:hypothetical protein
MAAVKYPELLHRRPAPQHLSAPFSCSFGLPAHGCSSDKSARGCGKTLDLNNTTGASDTLLTALNTLVVVEQAIPLLIIIPRAGVADAEQEDKTDKDGANSSRSCPQETQPKHGAWI